MLGCLMVLTFSIPFDPDRIWSWPTLIIMVVVGYFGWGFSHQVHDYEWGQRLGGRIALGVVALWTMGLIGRGLHLF